MAKTTKTTSPITKKTPGAYLRYLKAVRELQNEGMSAQPQDFKNSGKEADARLAFQALGEVEALPVARKKVSQSRAGPRTHVAGPMRNGLPSSRDASCARAMVRCRRGGEGPSSR
eukprot:5210657-Prymnesium_polylepis.1